MLSLVLAIYAAVVATFSLLFNYFREPAPLMHVSTNEVSAEYGKAYWTVALRNLGSASARHIKVRSRRGAGEWTPWVSLAPVLESKTRPDSRNEIGHSLLLTDAEYEALKSESTRASWKMHFQWTQGPISIIGRRRLLLRPDRYWTREQSAAWEG
ncbi:hypothetical protein [Curtobacterium sp. MCBA15_008]|uniref:hypothetical protein n=1 Tax=Curtobacterium sp. MCBA15_008 TaxID=1898736 RepID=UPI0008DDFA61|nr:hypothetical protein [Curtobacterium sp. MCBA15_008]OII04319.1 hypothetical protein BIU96_07925 [Curtobacterium sp. MCBA15_008]